jgi:hypothetical protein
LGEIAAFLFLSEYSKTEEKEIEQRRGGFLYRRIQRRKFTFKIPGFKQLQSRKEELAGFLALIDSGSTTFLDGIDDGHREYLLWPAVRRWR